MTIHVQSGGKSCYVRLLTRIYNGFVRIWLNSEALNKTGNTGWCRYFTGMWYIAIVQGLLNSILFILLKVTNSHCNEHCGNSFCEHQARSNQDSLLSTMLNHLYYQPISWPNCLFTLQGSRTGQVQGTLLEAMGPNILYRNVHTGPRQGKEPESIVSYCAGPVPCTCPCPVPMQCE